MTEQEAKVVLKIDEKETLEKMNKLEDKAKELRAKFEECFKNGDRRGLTKVTKELNNVNKQIDNLRLNAANIDAAMKRLDKASPRDLQRTIKLINSELNSGRVVRGSKEWDSYIAKLKTVKAELKKVNLEMQEQKGTLTSLKDKFNEWGAAAAGAIAAFAGVVMSGKQAVQVYAEIEQEMASVRKYTGMTAAEVEKLNEEFKKIDTRSSRVQLNQLAQEAGRLGKTSREDVLGFVRAADQINVALDELGEGATLQLSKLTNIFGDEAAFGTEKSLLKVGSVVNDLSQNCTASAGYLVDFSKRLAGVGAQAKMTIPQIMGFAAVLDTQGQAVEMSATAFSQLILKLYKDPAKFAKAAKLDVKEFTALLKEDANEAVITLLESLNKVGNIDALAPIFEEMGMDGARASGVMAALAKRIGDVRNQQIAATTAYREGTSVTKEFNVQNNTAQARLDKAKKGFTDMAASLGEKLMPVIRYCISGTSALMRALSVIVNFILKHKTLFLSLTAAVATYATVVALAAAKTFLLNAYTKIAIAVQTAWNYSLGLAKVAMIAFTKGTAAAKVELAALNKTLKSSPWGIILAAIAAIVVALTSLGKEMTEIDKIGKRVKSLIRGTAAEIKEERKSLDELYNTLKSSYEGSKRYEEAKKSLIEQYGVYIKDLIDENGRIIDLTQSYERLTKAVERNAKVRGLQNAQDELDTEYWKKYAEVWEELRNSLIYWGNNEDWANNVVKHLQEAVDSGTANKSNPDFAHWIGQVEQWSSIGVAPQSDQFIGGLKSAIDDLTPDFIIEGMERPLDIWNDFMAEHNKYKKSSKEVTEKLETIDPARTLTDEELDAKIKELEGLEEEIKNKGEAVVKIGKRQIILKEANYAETLQALRDAAAVRLNGGTGLEEEEEEEEPPQPDDERNETKSEKKARLAAEREANKALKEALKEQKRLMEERQAENLRLYQQEEISHLEYTKNKEAIDSEYLEAAMKVLEDKGLQETELYASLSLKREKIKETSLKRIKEVELKDLDSKHKSESAKNLALRASGLKDYKQYLADQEKLDLDLVNDKMKILEEYHLTETQEYAALLLKKEQMLSESLKREQEMKAADLKKSHDNRLLELQLDYMSVGNPLYGNKNAYDEAVFKESYDYLTSLLGTYAEGSEEWKNVEEQISKLISDDKVKRQTMLFDKAAELQNMYGQSSGSAREQAELDTLDELHKNGLISEETYQKAVADVKEKYRNEDISKARKVQSQYADMVVDLYQSWSKFFDNLGKEGNDFWDNLSDAASASFALITACMQQYSSLVAADRDLEIAKTEKKYDKEIEAAGNNKKKKEQIEKQKEAEVAKIKKKYNEKSMRIEIAQAIAQTAQAAIAAYASAAAIPATGWLMAPIAAGLAVAAGMAQVATIKKQHEAEAAGYYEGGFTGGSKYRKVAGVVHEGEFVLNHEAVNNPQLDPMLRYLDYAQKNNTVASLTAEDVSAALGQGRGVSARGEAAAVGMPTVITNSIDTSAIDRLNEVLEHGIHAEVIMDTDRGLYRSLRRYEKLINDPKR